MHRGYVELWRKIEDSDVWLDPYLLKMWNYCLIHANWEDKTFPWKTNKGYIRLRLFPGQFVTGRDVLGEATQMNSKTAYRRLETLEKLGMVSLKKTRNYTVVELVNWKAYRVSRQKSLKTNKLDGVLEENSPGNVQAMSRQCPQQSINKHYKNQKQASVPEIVESKTRAKEEIRENPETPGAQLKPEFFLNKNFSSETDFDSSLFNLNIQDED